MKGYEQFTGNHRPRILQPTLSCYKRSCMKRDGRLSRMLHVLLHMARSDSPVTSGLIAQMLGTNPVVVRRTMAGLREAGFVRSEKGHGGGWSLACDLAQVSLLDIYKALGEPTIFAIGNATETPGCLVEQAVNRALDDAFCDAGALFAARLRNVTLAGLAADFEKRFAAYGSTEKECPNAA